MPELCVKHTLQTEKIEKEGLVGALENLVFNDKMKTGWLHKVSCVDGAVNPPRNAVVKFSHAVSSCFVEGSVTAENHDRDNDWEGGRKKSASVMMD
jgi:hypothetical protein